MEGFKDMYVSLEDFEQNVGKYMMLAKKVDLFIVDSTNTTVWTLRCRQNTQQARLAKVLWDAYRPWSVSKLANLALPENQKGMLEDPETKGSAHNTGNAVDVSLYDLATGEQVEMISGFDEPPFRQFASYAGGTSRQRYLRDLLKEAMELYGFKGIEMEWWHFDYKPGTNWAHLNVNF